MISAFKKLIFAVAWRTDCRGVYQAVLRVNNRIHSGLSRKEIFKNDVRSLSKLLERTRLETKLPRAAPKTMPAKGPDA